jgi:hypothetical protein
VKKVLRWSWFAIRMLITIGLAAAAMSVGTTKFESVVLAGLVMIYTTLRAGILQLLIVSVATDLGAQHRFNSIASHLDHPRMDEFISSLSQTEKTKDDAETKVYAEMVVLGLMWLGALWVLLASV